MKTNLETQPRLRSKQTWLLAVVILLALAGCGGAAERLWLKAPDWSRAALVGTTRVGEPVPMVLDETGHIYLLFVEPAEPADRLRVAAFDRQAQLVWERTLEVGLDRPDNPGLLLDGESLHLLWISGNQLFTSQMDTTGSQADEPRRLSGEIYVESYAAGITADGELSVWFAGPRREPGLHVLTVNDSANGPVLVDPEGVQPSLQVDSTGAHHVVWLRRLPGFAGATILFATYPAGEYNEGREFALAEFALSPTISLFGPYLGLDAEQAYVFWTLRIATGLQAGSMESRYIHFPLDQPEAASAPERLRMPTSSDLAYEGAPSAALQAGQRVMLDAGGYPTSPALSGLGANSRQAPELALAFQLQVEHLYRDVEGQVSVAYLQDGAPTSYQLLSFTSSASTDPTIVSDTAGRLYITWLEKGDQPGFLVYLAGTDPQLITALSPITRQDAGRLSAEILFGVLSGAMLSPIITMIWLVAPLVVLGITSVIRREGTGRISLGTSISLLLTLLTFWFAKQLSLPGMQTYVPFSAWIAGIPPWLEPILRVAVPATIAAVGLAVAWYYTFGRSRKSALYFLLIYALVDGPLTMAVYGVLIYAAI